MESASGQSNRLFILLAIGLLGLVCVGLLGLGAVIYMLQARQAEQAAIPTATIFIPPPTPTYTSTPTTPPTLTPLPTPTATLVVNNQGQQAAAQATPIPSTEEPGASPTATSMLPQATEPVEVTATSTMVVQSPTPEVSSTPATAPVVPESGGVLLADSTFLWWVGLALLLVLGVGAVLRFKPAS